MKRQFAIFLMIVFVASLAVAHGNEEHVMGTVTSISSHAIMVQTTSNQTKEVAITDKTTFEKSGAPAKLDDLKVGDRVVIHAGKEGNKLVAHTVRFGATKTAAHSH
ncbi:MAG TPA: DUF5666 domain-containing protein [Candidatus Angelobacter sp.]